jgi:glucose-6-phosphate 1-dehydrogenase
MPTPLTLVIFGATGDLTARKLAPSLYRMACKGRLPEELKIVGAARTPLTDDAFRERLGKAVREFAKDDWNEEKWRGFARRVFYVAGDAVKPGGLDNLKKWLEKSEGGQGGRRLFYLAVAPNLYGDIVRQLGAEGLNRSEGDKWTRLIIEKPFGRD